MIKNLVLSKTKEYLTLKGIKPTKVGKMIMFTCPFCEAGTANTIPNSTTLNCLSCKKRFNLIDIVKKLENKEGSDDEIIEYLKELLKIDGVVTKKEENKEKELLAFYEKSEFDLVPVAVICPYCSKGVLTNGTKCLKCEGTGNYGKNPIEKAWTTKSHKNKEEWGQWLSNELNLGVKTGKISNITVVDVDTKDIPKELSKWLSIDNPITLTQITKNGYHFFFKYDSDFPKTRIDEYKIDMENDGGQVVISPSKTSLYKRYFVNLQKIIEMPTELKKILQDKITVPRKTHSEKIKEDIQSENFKINPADFLLKNNNLEGCCNASFIKLGGILRKNLNIKQTAFVLQLLNRHLLEHPMDDRSIDSMVQELDNYIVFDEHELAHEILEHIKEVKEITKSDLELSMLDGFSKGEGKKRFNKTLQYLLKEDKITQRGKHIKLIEDLDWTDTLINEGTPVGFKVPYFHDYAYFCKGDIIILGSQKKYGKTHLAMNMIKRLVKQGIKPYYVYNEKQGGRFAKIAMHLGLKEGDFWKARCSDPEGLILKPNSVTIYDWVRPNKKEGFARTDLLFNDLVQKAEKTDSFLICFVQLRRDNTFFASDQIGQDTSLLSRYIYEKDNEGTYTKFVLDDTRERKFSAHTIEIPSVYNTTTKEVKLIEELDEQEQKQIRKKLEKERK